MSNEKLIRNSTTEFLIFTAQNGEQSIEARYENETLWMTQKMLAQLFAVGTNTINYHLKEIFKSHELTEDSVIRKFRITANDDCSRKAIIKPTIEQDLLEMTIPDKLNSSKQKYRLTDKGIVFKNELSSDL